MSQRSKTIQIVNINTDLMLNSNNRLKFILDNHENKWTPKPNNGFRFTSVSKWTLTLGWIS